MATVVILEHALQHVLRVPYIAHALGERWVRAGHDVILHRGVNPPPADLAILHVDLTVVPQAYCAALSRYARVVNAAAGDASKRRVSQCVLARDDPWSGPVMVKANANVSGRAEALIAREQRSRGLPVDVPVEASPDGYRILPSRAAVPESDWTSPAVVVEKFVPERSAAGYHLRVWTFFGGRERSSLCTSPEPVIKSSNVSAREPVEVPPAMRAARRRLGFDFGKFDYVLHDGRYYLLDASRTPSAPVGPSAVALAPALDEIALGLGDFL